jgi:hypothetical protein
LHIAESNLTRGRIEAEYGIRGAVEKRSDVPWSGASEQKCFVNSFIYYSLSSISACLLAGKLFHTHILNWEMSRRSFWKVFIPDKEVYEVMVLIAVDRFREVGWPKHCELGRASFTHPGFLVGAGSEPKSMLLKRAFGEPTSGR